MRRIIRRFSLKANLPKVNVWVKTAPLRFAKSKSLQALLSRPIRKHTPEYKKEKTEAGPFYAELHSHFRRLRRIAKRKKNLSRRKKGK